MKKICYKKLWKLLIDKDLKKKDLCQMTSISPASMARMTRNKNVSTEQLVKICTALNCGLSDIVEVIE